MRRTDKIAGRGLVMRFGDGEGRPDPVYGHLLQNQAVQGMQPEGRIVLTAPADPDGALNVALTLDRGALDPATHQSVRIAPPLRGRALLERIDADAVLALADPDDRDGDGISGRARMIEVDGTELLGRYGWKAAHDRLEEQIADAFATRPRPVERAPSAAAWRLHGARARLPGRADRRERALRGPRAFGGDDRARRRLCAKPRRRRKRRGRRRRAATSSPRPAAPPAMSPRLAATDGEPVAAYTDLLLHDMGPELDDGVGEPGVASAEWRTAPLLAHGGRRRAAAICMTAARRRSTRRSARMAARRTRRARAIEALPRRRAAGARRLRGGPMSLRFALSLLAVLLPRRRRPAQTTSGEGTPIAADRDRGRIIARVVEQAVADYIVPAYADAAWSDRRAWRRRSTISARRRRREARRSSRRLRRTMTAWAGVDFFRFGPMARDGRYERFAFFPDVHGTGARQLRRFLAGEDEKLLQPGALAAPERRRAGPAGAGIAALLRPKALLARRRRRSLSAARSRWRSPRTCDAIAADALAGWSGETSWADADREARRRTIRSTARMPRR